MSSQQILKILVIDDKRVVRDLFDFTLGYLGHAVQTVNNAGVALEIIKREEFHIAFLDIIMPDCDGVELLRKIKKVSPQLPIVMMSGFSVEDKRSQCREIGAVACLKKPFEIEDIRRVVKEAIGRDI